jgi:hypothetical protein
MPPGDAPSRLLTAENAALGIGGVEDLSLKRLLGTSFYRLYGFSVDSIASDTPEVKPKSIEGCKITPMLTSPSSLIAIY